MHFTQSLMCSKMCALNITVIFIGGIPGTVLFFPRSIHYSKSAASCTLPAICTLPCLDFSVKETSLPGGGAEKAARNSERCLHSQSENAQENPTEKILGDYFYSVGEGHTRRRGIFVEEVSKVGGRRG